MFFGLALLTLFLFTPASFADEPEPVISKFVMGEGDSNPVQTQGPGNSAEFSPSNHYEVYSEIVFEQKDSEETPAREMERQRLDPIYPIGDQEVRPATEEILEEFKQNNFEYYDRYPCTGASCTATLSVEVRDFEDD